MPTADLSLVSRSLQHLLEKNIHRLGSPGAHVTLGYPDDRAGAQNTVNLHLYHVAEDQFNRNVPGPGNDRNNVATTPMSLSLFYLMTAHDNVDATKATTEQQIMGYALKTLHDFAIIDRNTKVVDQNNAATSVLQQGIDDGSTTLEVILRPLTPEDALAFWASEQQQPVRLSAYYEVRLVQLAPEPAETFPYPVLTIGEWVGPKMDPLISASRSAIRFAHPASMNVTLPDAIEISPARAFLDVPPVSFADTNHFWLLGSGLASGIRRQLVLSNPEWRSRGVPGAEIKIDEAIQPAPPTTVQFQDGRVDIRLSPHLGYVAADGTNKTLALFPGTHRARVEIILADSTNGPAPHQVVRRSNEVLFQVAPRIDTITQSGPPANRRYVLKISPCFDLADPDLEVILIVEGDSYTAIAGPVGNLTDETMIIASDRITFKVPFPVNATGVHPVRLSVNGVDAQPFWIETP